MIESMLQITYNESNTMNWDKLQMHRAYSKGLIEFKLNFKLSGTLSLSHFNKSASSLDNSYDWL